MIFSKKLLLLIFLLFFIFYSQILINAEEERDNQEIIIQLSNIFKFKPGTDYNEVTAGLKLNKIKFIENKNEITFYDNKLNNKLIQIRFIFENNKLINTIAAVEGSIYYYNYCISLIRINFKFDEN